MGKKNSQVINQYHLNANQPAQLQVGIYDLRSYLAKNSSHSSKPHIHSYYQIIWFTSGYGKHFVDFKEYDVAGNVMFFVAKNQVHYFDGNTDYDGVLIHFNELFVAQSDSEVDFFLKCDLFNNSFQRLSCFMQSKGNDILDQLLALMKGELAQDNEFGRDELLRIYLKAFLIQVQRRKNEIEGITEKTPFVIEQKRFKLIRFVNLIDQNFTKGLAVSDYALHLNVSSRTLSDLTNQILGKTPSQMIQERIILEAQRLLSHSTLQINEIGYRLGFEDPSYFVRFFKKHAGTSPLEFRRLIS